MSSVIISDSFAAVLTPLRDQTEVRDEQGKMLGVFLPVAQEPIVDYAKIRALFDPNELRERKLRDAGHPGYTIEQVMEHLHSLEKET